MKIVLLTDVHGLGWAGEVKEVADGYGRNFLIPRGLAEFASPGVLKRVQAQQRAEAKRQRAAGDELARVAEALEGLHITLKARVGAQDRLYGAITSGDIADGIAQATGHEVDRKRIELGEPIRHLGEYDVVVKLGRELQPRVRVVVEEEKS